MKTILEFIISVWTQYGQVVSTALVAFVLRWLEKAKMNADFKKRLNGME